MIGSNTTNREKGLYIESACTGNRDNFEDVRVDSDLKREGSLGEDLPFKAVFILIRMDKSGGRY